MSLSFSLVHVYFVLFSLIIRYKSRDRASVMLYYTMTLVSLMIEVLISIGFFAYNCLFFLCALSAFFHLSDAAVVYCLSCVRLFFVFVVFCMPNYQIDWRCVCLLACLLFFIYFLLVSIQQIGWLLLCDKPFYYIAYNDIG